jgi:Zn-finger nucleic acid-binding protein
MPACPRDGTPLREEVEHGVKAEHCPRCRGGWYDFGELEALEAKAAPDPADRIGMIEYAKVPSEIACPSCGKQMVAFDYRATSLQLDACPDEHGFWLDAGESQRVVEIMREYVRGLHRSRGATATWNRAREAGFQGGVIDQIRRMFRR